MSILPSLMSDQIKKTKLVSDLIKIPREYGIDFKTGQLTGQIVDGIEAVKVWIWLCLKTQRFRYSIHSWGYGADLEQYIGVGATQEYLETTVQEEIATALSVNVYIQGIENFEVSANDDRLNHSFLVRTKFGDVEVVNGTIR